MHLDGFFYTVLLSLGYCTMMYVVRSYTIEKWREIQFQNNGKLEYIRSLDFDEITMDESDSRSKRP